MRAGKIVSVLLVIALLLTGCGSGNKNKTKVGVLFASYTHSAQQEALLAGLNEAGYLSVPMSANGDHELQKTQLDGLAVQKYPLVIIEPTAAENAGQLAEILKKEQIPGIFIGQEPEEEVLDSWDKLFYVGVDETCQGYLQGQMIQNSMDGGDINGDGVVSFAVIRGPEGDRESELITEYCDDALEGRLLESCVSDGSRENSRELARELLNKYGKDVEVLLCNTDELALGAVQAVLAGGWTPGQDIYLVGVGGAEEMLGLIDQGTCFGTVTPDESSRAQQIAKIAKALLENESVEKRFYAGYLAVTAENVAIFHE